jgi:hypothetical protein
MGKAVTSLSPKKPQFDPRPVHIVFAVGKMSLGCDFL